MALFDQSMFDQGSYQGLLGSLLNGLNFPQPQPSQGFAPPQTPTGPTFANGNSGSMGGVSFPIIGQAPAEDPAALPANARPTVGQAPQAVQQPAPPASTLGGAPQPQGLDMLQRLSAASHNFAAGPGLLPRLFDAAQGLATGVRTDPAGMQQQSQLATYRTLIDKGVPEPDARAAMTNPKVLDAVVAKYFEAKPGINVNNRLVDPVTGRVISDMSDTALKAPETREFTDPVSGDKFQGTWNAKLNRWERIDPQSLPMASAQAGGATTAPAATGGAIQQPGIWAPRTGAPSSPISVPPPPPGVNAAKYREASATKTADEMEKLRDKGLGAIDFLTLTPRAKEIFKNSPDVFGPWSGSETYNNWVRAPLSGISGGAANNMEKYNEVNSVANQLASTGLKARYGARPTNIDVQMNKDMFGGIRNASPDVAVRNLENMEKEHFDTLQQSVRMGLINPAQIPSEIVQRGIDAGVLDPQYFPGASKSDKGGWVPAGKGVRIRERK